MPLFVRRFLCGLGIHLWAGCVCRWCNTVRLKASVKDHSWEGCKCKKCFTQRDEEHSFDRTAAEKWRRCRCIKCAITCHDWSEGCACRYCEAEHHWGTHCVCSKCGNVRRSELQCEKERKVNWTGFQNLLHRLERVDCNSERCVDCGFVCSRESHRWVDSGATVQRCANCGRERVTPCPVCGGSGLGETVFGMENDFYGNGFGPSAYSRTEDCSACGGAGLLTATMKTNGQSS